MSANVSRHVTPSGARQALLGFSLAVLSVITGVWLAELLHTVLDATTVLLSAVLLAAWFGGLASGIVASLLATLAVDYYFIPPLHTIAPEITHLPRMVVFALLAASFSAASAARRRAERSLRQARDEMERRVRERTAALEQANEQLRAEIAERRRGEEALKEKADLLDLTHDTVFVRDMREVITFWNRGAEEQYGWTRAEAVGRVSHELLRTVFPAPLAGIKEELMRAGRWEGELVHARRDGTMVVTTSRWALQRDEGDRPIAVLETNNDITDRKRNEHALEDLAGRLIYAQEDERSRIGRELHDHVSQRLGILAINIDQLRMDPSTPTAIAPALDNLREQTSDITKDIHNLSHRLHSTMLDHLGVIPALQRLVDECSERYAIPIVFTHTPLPTLVPSDVALCLFRVAEEGLANIAKHSAASAARVEVTADTRGIHLRIADQGVGFDPNRLDTQPGLGFVSMRERLRLVRGTVRVHSVPAQGTTVEVWVPAQHQAG
jgi:PAS domain S-box-containing protein